jgi:hypothetical protein
MDRERPGCPPDPVDSSMEGWMDSSPCPSHQAGEVMPSAAARVTAPIPVPWPLAMGEDSRRKPVLTDKGLFGTQLSQQRTLFWHGRVPDLLIPVYFCNRLVSEHSTDLCFPSYFPSACGHGVE